MGTIVVGILAVLPLQSGVVSDSLPVNSLLQTVSAVEAIALKKALRTSSFTADQQLQPYCRAGAAYIPQPRAYIFGNEML